MSIFSFFGLIFLLFPEYEANVHQNQADLISKQINVVHSGNPFNGQELNDKCIGPLKLTYKDYPVLFTQHNYCGGKENFGDLRPGDYLSISNAGRDSGLYLIAEKKLAPKESRWSVFKSPHDAIFYTCISEEKMILNEAIKIDSSIEKFFAFN